MKMIVYLLGLTCIASSTFLILYTRETVNAFKSLFQKYPLKYLSAIPAVFALLFMIASSATIYPWVLRIIGLLAACEAVLALTNPHSVYSKMLDWYFGDVSDGTQRLFGIIGIIFGTVLLTWVR